MPTSRGHKGVRFGNWEAHELTHSLGLLCKTLGPLSSVKNMTFACSRMYQTGLHSSLPQSDPQPCCFGFYWGPDRSQTDRECQPKTTTVALHAVHNVRDHVGQPLLHLSVFGTVQKETSRTPISA